LAKYTLRIITKGEFQLNKKIEEILNSNERLIAMKVASKNEGITDAAYRIYKEVEDLIKKH